MYPWQASQAVFKSAYNILAFFLDTLFAVEGIKIVFQQVCQKKKIDIHVSWGSCMLSFSVTVGRFVGLFHSMVLIVLLN